jgi:hypothetical protein
LIVGLEFQTEHFVVHPEGAVPAAADRIRHDDLHLLRHHADIGLVAAVVAEAIEAKAVVELTEKSDVVLEGDVGPAATATAAAPAAAAESPATAASADSTPPPRLE